MCVAITEIEQGDTLCWSKWWLFGDVMPESEDIIIKSSDSFSRQQLQVSFESGVKLLRRDHYIDSIVRDKWKSINYESTES